MKGKPILWVSFALLVMMLVSACAQTNPQSAAASSNQATVVVMRTLDFSVLQPSNTPPPPPTSTSPPTEAPVVTEMLAPPASEPVVPAASPTPSCTNQAEFIKHLSVPDNSNLKTETIVSKVWLIKNAGTCTWSTSYSLIFASGDPILYSPETLPLQKEVKPGETLELSVFLITPATPGTYSGQWMLKDEQGNLFGIGEGGAQPLTVTILVDISHKKLGPPS